VAERVKLGDWWPAILASPLVLCLPAVWKHDRAAVAAMRAVDARIVKVERYECPGGSGFTRHRRSGSGPCWEITLEYHAAAGQVRHKLKYLRSASTPHKGDWSSVLVNTSASASIPDGTDEIQARHGPIGYTIFAAGFFWVACYASVLRSRRRLERGRATAPST
jgi:hypothetical protein